MKLENRWKRKEKKDTVETMVNNLAWSTTHVVLLVYNKPHVRKTEIPQTTRQRDWNSPTPHSEDGRKQAAETNWQTSQVGQWQCRCDKKCVVLSEEGTRGLVGIFSRPQGKGVVVLLYFNDHNIFVNKKGSRFCGLVFGTYIRIHSWIHAPAASVCCCSKYLQNCSQ